jgi:hypothetical protein
VNSFNDFFGQEVYICEIVEINDVTKNPDKEHTLSLALYKLMN